MKKNVLFWLGLACLALAVGICVYVIRSSVTSMGFMYAAMGLMCAGAICWDAEGRKRSRAKRNSQFTIHNSQLSARKAA